MLKKLVIILSALALALPLTIIGTGAAKPAATAGDSVRLPIVMYHDLMQKRTGRYIVSPAQLESDITAIKNSGYTIVSPQEVIAYTEGTGTLPARPVMITFDDGHYNNAYYGLPVFERTDAKVTLAIVGEYADRYSDIVKSERDNPHYSCLTWEEIRELSASPLISLACHSYAMHGQTARRGALPLKHESDEDYVRALTADTERVQACFEAHIGTQPTVYAYPFGLYKPLTRTTLESLGYKMLLTCNERVSTVRRGDPASIKALGRFNREGSYTSAQLLALLEK